MAGGGRTESPRRAAGHPCPPCPVVAFTPPIGPPVRRVLPRAWNLEFAGLFRIVSSSSRRENACGCALLALSEDRNERRGYPRFPSVTRGYSRLVLFEDFRRGALPWYVFGVGMFPSGRETESRNAGRFCLLSTAQHN